ncbi:MAG TPA: hypothetical protein VKI17_10735 [Gemmataceae bacterium]|nr:hypothetical protein [Gemmataceae bacterium]
MSNSRVDSQLERLEDGVILQQLDDVCFVRLGDRTVNAAQTRELGEKLIAFIEKAGCRKLVMSFEGVESIYGFLLDNSEQPPNRPHLKVESPKQRSEHVAGSDLWLG